MNVDSPIIQIENLTKTYKKFTALNNLNLNVQRGEFMGLLGPNGAGKSTTLKMATGLIKPTSGSVRINGIDISTDLRNGLSDVGCIIETPEFYPRSTPMGILRYIGRIKGLDRDEINIRSEDVLREMRIWDWRDSDVNTFSKGMRQRVALAQALLSNPSLLILDEPTTGLDPRGMVEMRQILNSLKKRNVSLLLSTHNLAEVSEICESVTILRQGKSVMSGDVQKLIREDASGITELTIKTIKPITEESLREIKNAEGVENAVLSKETEAVISFSGTNEQQSALIAIIMKYNLGLISMNEGTGSNLEKLYMEMSIDQEAS